MKIAIIDDGINEKYFSGVNLVDSVEIDSECNIIKRTNYNEYENSHGTICCSIINKYTKGASFASIKILNKINRKGNVHQLIKALDYCMKRKYVIINISLGTIQFQDFLLLESKLADLYREGYIIVAANHNHNLYSMPACCGFVIGVASIESLYNTKRIIRDIMYAPSKHYLRNYRGSILSTSIRNSYATPFITALVHENKKNCIDSNFTEIIKKIALNKKVRNHIGDFEVTAERDIRFDTYIVNLNKNIYIRKIRCPLIGLLIKNPADSYLKKLNALFKKEGYNSAFYHESWFKKISNHFFKKVTLMQIIHCIAEYYNYDIMLIHTDEDHDKEYFDLYIDTNKFEIADCYSFIVNSFE